MLNRHDTWERFCEKYKDSIEKTGLPTEIVRAEHRFRDLLRDGIVEIRGHNTSLDTLDANQWLSLQEFAGVFFHEFESYAPLDEFPAFRKEAERRRSV
jgi:hypothetical protein